MGRNKILPTILGMNPPTKSVLLMRTTKPLNGYACIIQHAEFQADVKAGDEVDIRRGELKGMCCWLQFTDKEAMRSFGQMLIDFANGKMIGNRRENDEIR